LDAAAGEARTALERGDTAAASRALGRILAIDTHHPLVAELTARLNRHFEIQAGQARRAADVARGEAERAGAAATPAFRAAARLVDEAEPMLERGAYADATRKLVEAGDGFGRARRSPVTAAAENAAAQAAARAATLGLPGPPERTSPPSSPAMATPGTAPPAPHPPTGATAGDEPREAPATASEPPPPSLTPPPAAGLPEAEPGSLRVTARPWADVSIDDVKRGRTPLDRVALAPGRHTVVLVHPDYQPLRRVLTIRSGETATLNVDMRDEAIRQR
jgi:hypothetical protein